MEVGKQLYEIDQEIAGNVFKINVSELLHTDEPFSEITEEEIEEQLNNSAYYQATWISAIRHLIDHRNHLKIDYNVWYAEKSQEAERKLLDRDLKRAEAGTITKGNVKKASKNDMDNWIMTNYELEYREKQDELFRVENLIEAYKEFLITFRKRGDDLRLILKEERLTERNSNPSVKVGGM